MSSKNYGYFVQRQCSRKSSPWVDWDGILDSLKEAKDVLRIRTEGERGEKTKHTFRIVKRKYSSA